MAIENCWVSEALRSPTGGRLQPGLVPEGIEVALEDDAGRYSVDSALLPARTAALLVEHRFGGHRGQPLIPIRYWDTSPLAKFLSKGTHFLRLRPDSTAQAFGKADNYSLDGVLGD